MTTRRFSGSAEPHSSTLTTSTKTLQGQTSSSSSSSSSSSHSSSSSSSVSSSQSPSSSSSSLLSSSGFSAQSLSLSSSTSSGIFLNPSLACSTNAAPTASPASSTSSTGNIPNLAALLEGLPPLKAKLFKEILTMFAQWDSLRKPEKYVDKKKVKKKVYRAQLKEFVESMEGVLGLAQDLQRKWQIKWAEVFHNRLVAYRELLGGERYKHYLSLLQTYQKQFSEREREREREREKEREKERERERERQGTSSGELNASGGGIGGSGVGEKGERGRAGYLEVAHQLLQFLESHRMDPDGSVVGMVPSHNVLAKFSYYLDMLAEVRASSGQQVDGGSTIHHHHSSSSGMASSIVPVVDFEAETSRESLVRKIVAWSKFAAEDAEKVVAEVRRMASLLESVPHMAAKGMQPKEGELVVAVIGSVRREGEAWRGGVLFARCLGRAGGGSGGAAGERFALSLSPDERATELVDATHIFPFTPDMVDALTLQDPFKMERLVDDPTTDLSRKLNEAIKKKTMAFLAQQGVDIDVIEKSQRLDVGIADLPSIKKTRNLLEDLIAKHPSVELFYKEIDAFGADEIKAFISNLGPRDIFLPTRERALKKLRSIEWSSLPRMRIARHLRCCEEALEHLQLEKRLLMNGTTKDLTTEWWLTLIKDECDKFLVRRGFNFDATAYDYIADPPSDPRAVLDNLKLIKEILNPNEDKHNVQKLIKRLKEQIYPKIDLFINNAQIVLAEQFRMDYDNFSLEEAEAKFHNEKDKLEDVSRNWIEDMLKDIQYLKEMKRLEKPQNCKEKILDIVPVTGLIVGRFYRLENELRTVIEQWDEIFEEFEAAEAKAKQDQELQQLLQTQFLETNASANYTNSSAASTPTNTSSSSLPLPTSNNNQSSSASSPASSIIVSGTNSSSSEGGHHHSSSVLQGASTPSSSSPSSSSVESSPRTEKREPRKNRLSVEMKIKQAKPKAAKRTNHS